MSHYYNARRNPTSLFDFLAGREVTPELIKTYLHLVKKERVQALQGIRLSWKRDDTGRSTCWTAQYQGVTVKVHEPIEGVAHKDPYSVFVGSQHWSNAKSLKSAQALAREAVGYYLGIAPNMMGQMATERQQQKALQHANPRRRNSQIGKTYGTTVDAVKRKGTAFTAGILQEIVPGLPSETAHKLAKLSVDINTIGPTLARKLLGRSNPSAVIFSKPATYNGRKRIDVRRGDWDFMTYPRVQIEQKWGVSKHGATKGQRLGPSDVYEVHLEKSYHDLTKIGECTLREAKALAKHTLEAL